MVRDLQLAHIHTDSDRRNNKWKILECIFHFEPQGISTKELEENTGLNHDTISNHCKELVLEGRITKKNKKAKYHLTKKTYEDPVIKAWIFKKNAMEKIRHGNIPFDKENAFCNIGKNHPDEDNYNKQMLFSFANKIGSFIIYAILEALKLWSLAPQIKGKTTAVDLGGRNTDKLVLDWLENVVDPIDLLREFLALLSVRNEESMNNPALLVGLLRGNAPTEFIPVKTKPQMKRQLGKLEPRSLKRSDYKPDNTNLEKLVKDFSDIFPHQFTQLEEIKYSLDRVIQVEKKESAISI